MLIASLTERSLRCPDCNTYYEEWDPQRGGHVHSYYAKSQFCLGCKAKQDSYDAIKENNKDNSSVMNGIQVYLDRNDSAPPIRSPLTNKPIIPRQMKSMD